MSHDHATGRALRALTAVVLAVCAAVPACASRTTATSSTQLTSGQCAVRETRCSADADCCSNWCVNQYCANREP